MIQEVINRKVYILAQNGAMAWMSWFTGMPTIPKLFNKYIKRMFHESFTPFSIRKDRGSKFDSVQRCNKRWLTKAMQDSDGIIVLFGKSMGAYRNFELLSYMEKLRDKEWIAGHVFWISVDMQNELKNNNHRNKILPALKQAVNLYQKEGMGGYKTIGSPNIEVPNTSHMNILETRIVIDNVRELFAEVIDHANTL